MCALPACSRAEPRTTALCLIRLTALFADSGARRQCDHLALVSSVKDRAVTVPDVESKPSMVVLAGVLRALDPFHAADSHDVRAVRQEWCRLPGRGPIRVHPPVVGANTAVEHGEFDVDGARVTMETLPGRALHH